MNIPSLIKAGKFRITKGSIKGLIEINNLALNIFINNPSFLVYRESLGKDKKSVDTVIRAVKLREFPIEKEVGWSKYKKLLTSASLKEQLSREIILFFIDKAETFGLNDYELEVLKTSCLLAKHYDELCLLWREDVTHNTLNKQAKKLNLNNKYTVLKKKNSKIVQIPYSVAYSDLITTIYNGWNELATRLVKLKSKEALGLAQYFLAYSQALEEKSLDKLTDSWLGLSRVWMKDVTLRIQPIHAEEYSYYDPNSIRVFPDFRLSLKVESLESDMAKTQESLKKYLGELFGDLEIFKSSLNALNHVQLYPIVDVVYSGSLDFQPAGQSLPNDDLVQKEYGTKVFLNGEVIASRWEIALNLAKKVFPKDYRMFQNVDPDYDGTAIMVAGHEYGEPLFTDVAVVEALGNGSEALLNEDLATLCITGIMAKRYENKEISNQAYVNHAIDLLGCYLRYIDTARGVSHLQPYYVGMCLLGLRRMLDCGFIHKYKNDWRVDLSKLDTLYAMSLADLQRQVMIAETKSKTMALNYLAYAFESNEVKEIINLTKSK